MKNPNLSLIVLWFEMILDSTIFWHLLLCMQTNILKPLKSKLSLISKSCLTKPLFMFVLFKSHLFIYSSYHFTQQFNHKHHKKSNKTTLELKQSLSLQRQLGTYLTWNPEQGFMKFHVWILIKKYVDETFCIIRKKKVNIKKDGMIIIDKYELNDIIGKIDR